MVTDTLDFPRNILLHLTEVCNLRCKMCYFWGESGSLSTADTKSKPLEIDFDIIKQLIHELSPTKPSYSLFGGEPLLYSHFDDLIIAIKNNGSQVDTPTNGTLLTSKARILVQTGFDSVRVSLDGPRHISDFQRGLGSYDKAVEGIHALYEERKLHNAKKPIIGIIYTVTPYNYDSIEDLFLNDLNLSEIDWITIQLENFLTMEMGEEYTRLLKSEFNISSDVYWRGMIREPKDFRTIDTSELVHQVSEVKKAFRKLNKNILLLPPTLNRRNLDAYFQANWSGMEDLYESCLVPWFSADVVANGDIAPCHVFYDLVMGNLHENSFTEIWNSEKYHKFREYMKNNSFMPICPGCCILYLSGKKSK